MIKGYLTTDLTISQHKLSSGNVLRQIKSDLSLTFKQAGNGAMVLIINITKITKSVKAYMLVCSLSGVGDGEQRT